VAFLSQADRPGSIAAGAAALAGDEPAVMLGPFGRHAPPERFQAAAYVARGDRGSAADSIWISRGVQTVDAQPVVEVHETGATALLLVLPPRSPYTRD